jgi:sulfatase modifying factor 1
VSGAPSGSAAGSAAGSASPGSSASAKAPPAPAPPLPKEDFYPKTIPEQRDAMFERMKAVLDVSDEQLTAVRAIMELSKATAQGNPEVSEYALTRKECRERRAAAGVVDEDVPACAARNMVPIPPKDGSPATVCIDRYEFPNVACDYPVTWVSAKQADDMCRALGKRMCDAHEWEGGCAGKLLPVEEEYSFGRARKESKSLHNGSREIVWAYGPAKDHAKCGTGSSKNEKCTTQGIGWKRCGSNTYPAGSFPACKSPLGVYDQHGNAAEHMNLPLKAEQLASVPGGKLGETEMKGSWFIFQKYEAHDDDCRWRAPDWHASRVQVPGSHANYHLGFRCCKSL